MYGMGSLVWRQRETMPIHKESHHATGVNGNKEVSHNEVLKFFFFLHGRCEAVQKPILKQVAYMVVTPTVVCL